MLGPGDREVAGAAWQALDAVPDVGSLTTSWPWTSTWLDTFGGDVPHRFVVAEAAGEPVATALLTFSGDRLRGRTLHLGTAGEPPECTVFVEHNALHAVPSHEDVFAAALLTAARELGGWDRFAIEGFRPDAAQALALAGSSRWHPEAQGCPVTDLEAVRAAGGDVVGVLSSSRRARARRSLRAFGDLETTWCDDATSARAALDELAELNRRRWEGDGEHTPFSDDRFVAFHRALIERLVPAGDAWIFQVRDGEGTVASTYCLRDGKRALFYQSGVRAATDNRLRPGVAAHVLGINACAARGLDVYDFLAPPSRYKQELATGTDWLVWAHCDGPSLLNPVRGLLRRMRQAAAGSDRRET